MVETAQFSETEAIERLKEVEAETAVQTVSISSQRLLQGEMRLDAGYFNSTTAMALEALESSDLPLRRLADVTESIFIPPRFKRVYVDKDHGIPFLQGSHVVHFEPADLKYLSRVAHKRLDRWIIKAGWILVTCSGTIGRVTIALQQWNNWAASQHIMRIVPEPNGPCPSGYIYAYLKSHLGQAQFNGIYGAVVDELTAEHVENILIPVPETTEQQDIVNSINDLAIEAVKTKELALGYDASAVSSLKDLMHIPSKPA